jgi:hypothetical protein
MSVPQAGQVHDLQGGHLSAFGDLPVNAPSRLVSANPRRTTQTESGGYPFWRSSTPLGGRFRRTSRTCTSSSASPS